MLECLSISNFAVIEKATVEFSPGLNVVTGETGAGKSVLMRALELSLGMRSSGVAVRDGAKEARVEARFSMTDDVEGRVNAVLDECGIETQGGVLFLRRTVSAAGVSRSWINDCQASLSTLKRVGGILADFHGPRANQEILSAKRQLSFLDSFAGLDMSAYAGAWRSYTDAVRRIEEASSGAVSPEEAEFLRYQVSELEAAELSPDDEDLASRHAAAAHMEEICSSAEEATAALGGDGGAEESLAAARMRFASMARHLPEADGWRAQTEEISAMVEELSRSVADAVSRLDVDPGEFEKMDLRLGTLQRLKRKYLGPAGGTVAALLETLEKKRDALAAFDNLADTLRTLEEKRAEAEKALHAEAARLTAKRRRAAKTFSAAVVEALRDLGFAKAAFSVDISPAEYSATGADAAEFMFEPNPGQAARPLREIASSGEIARVMLALKGLAASGSGTGTIVFDEIDANIGGETGRAVGRRMRDLAKGRQVIAITHLPQSAVYADRHLHVTKKTGANSVHTEVAAVEGEGRISEIVRMLGGDGAASARKHAEELIRNASNEKKRR